MHAQTVRYLDAYIERLRAVRAEADVYGDLAVWQHENLGVLPIVLDDLNSKCSLKDSQALRDHPPTTAVGALEGIVIVAANPPGTTKSTQPKIGIDALSTRLRTACSAGTCSAATSRR